MHVDLVALSKKATREAIDALEEEAARLIALDEVVSAGVIEATKGSDYDLAFFFVLRDFTALEPFGTNPAYAKFLQAGVAPLLRAFGGADVRLEGDMASVETHGAFMALAAADETYDWEVRAALEQWL